MRLTKLRSEFIDQKLSKDSYVAFPIKIFKSKAYKEWLRNRKLKNN